MYPQHPNLPALALKSTRARLPFIPPSPSPSSTGSFMNLLTSLAAYACICKELGQPFRCVCARALGGRRAGQHISPHDAR